MTPPGGRPATGWLIDLHVHTSPLSTDSALTPDVLMRRSIELGMSAVCVTEHNRLWSATEARELSERFGLPVLRGIEVSTDAGHVLVFGLDEFDPEMFRVERLCAAVQVDGAAAVLAHPVREPRFRRPWPEVRGMFHALEALNGDDNGGAADLVFSIARSLGMATTGGSDAHSGAALGRCATRFHDAVRDERDLITALRSGRFEAVDLTNIR